MAEGLRAFQNNRKTRIWQVCAEEWPKRNSNDNYNYADCSGFGKSVAARFNIKIADGQANDIFDYFQSGGGRKDGWSINGTGSDGCLITALAAEEGAFGVAAWKSASGSNGHVAILASYMPNALKQYKPVESKTVAFWGTLGGADQLFETIINAKNQTVSVKGRLSESFGTPKHPAILYASYSNWVGKWRHNLPVAAADKSRPSQVGGLVINKFLPVYCCSCLHMDLDHWRPLMFGTAALFS